MFDAVLAKFSQHERLSAILLSTGKAEIVEASPRDSYWGSGRDGQGLNKLGKTLVKVRSLLKMRQLKNMKKETTLPTNSIGDEQQQQ